MTEVLTVKSVRGLGGLRPTRVSDRVAKIDTLIYGPPKLGKTTLALTSQDVPDMMPYLHIAIERGEETIRDTYPDTPVLFLTEDDDGNILETAEQKWDRFCSIYEELRRPGHGYRTVCLDTLDELQTINIGFIMENAEAVLSGKQDADVPSMREYGKSRTQMKRMIRAFQDLDMNVIWLCHSKNDQDEKTKRWSKKPALVGQLQDEVGGMVNNLLYLTMYPATKTEPVERVLITASDGEIQAGTRSRVLNDIGEITDPTMSKVWYPLVGA